MNFNRKKTALIFLIIFVFAVIAELILVENDLTKWLSVSGSLGMAICLYIIVREETKKENEQNI